MLANWLNIIGRLVWWLKRPVACEAETHVEATCGSKSAISDDGAAELVGALEPAIARARHQNFLLSARLSSVAQQNVPSARAVERLGRNTATNRPISAAAKPVKVAKPQAWITARSRTAPRSTHAADIVEMRPARVAHRTRRTTLALAA